MIEAVCEKSEKEAFSEKCAILKTDHVALPHKSVVFGNFRAVESACVDSTSDFEHEMSSCINMLLLLLLLLLLESLKVKSSCASNASCALLIATVLGIFAVSSQFIQAVNSIELIK